MEHDPREIPGETTSVTGGRFAMVATTGLSLSIALVSTATLLLAWQSTVASRDVQREVKASVVENRKAQDAHTCTSFLGQLQIISRIDAVARSANVQVPEQTLKMNQATRNACARSGINVDYM